MASPTPPNLGNLQYLSQEERAARRLKLPPDEDFWVFGYGSLMWHPGFPHVEVRPARLRGLHRSFCVSSHRYRGTPEAPARGPDLARGDPCQATHLRAHAGGGAETGERK